MRKHSTNVVSIVFLLFALAVAIWAVLQFNGLKREVAQQRSALEQMKAASLFAEAAPYSIVDLVNPLEAMCQGNQEIAEVKKFCDAHTPSFKMLRLFATALQARISAARTDRYDNAFTAYGALAEFARSQPPSDWQRGWLALALEGIAYSYMKTERTAEARKTIDEAVRLNPADAGVGATALKIKCLQKGPKDEVAAAYKDLKARLDKTIASARPGSVQRRNAQAERELFAGDAELYLLCDYADLTPNS